MSPLIPALARIALAVTITLGATACSDGTDRAVNANEQRPDWAKDVGGDSGNQDPSSPETTRPPLPPSIDPSAMPPAGVITAEIDDHSYAFPLDAAVLGHACELSAERVQLQFQAPNASLQIEFADLGPQGGPPGQFAGNASVFPASLNHAEGEGYATTTQQPPRIVIKAPHVVIEAEFVYRENHSDAQFDEVGTGTIRATCP